jgi:hypothetical protein
MAISFVCFLDGTLSPKKQTAGKLIQGQEFEIVKIGINPYELAEETFDEDLQSHTVCHRQVEFSHPEKWGRCVQVILFVSAPGPDPPITAHRSDVLDCYPVLWHGYSPLRS